MAQRPFFYQFTGNDAIRLLAVGRGGTRADFPYSGYPRFFPEAFVELSPLPEADQEVIKALNKGKADEWEVRQKKPHLCFPQHQIGGEPFLVQKNPDYQGDGRFAEKVTCPECGRVMPFLAAIGDETRGAGGFTGIDFVQVLFHYCKRDHIVAAFQQCD
ncbi:MAG TPA: hypothetical protein VFD58_25750 [Blastocatellia bacterium]|nr:hypothetical protein [Blastocatellia bacterium]